MNIISCIVEFPFVWFFDFLRLKDELRIEGRRLTKMWRRLWDGNGNWDSKTRIYNVTYIDGLGNVNNRICKMGLWSGNTYWQD